MGDITYPVIRQNFDQRITAGEFQGAERSKHATGRQFTTPEMIAMEREAIAKLASGRDTLDPIMRLQDAMLILRAPFI